MVKGKYFVAPLLVGLTLLTGCGKKCECNCDNTQSNNNNNNIADVTNKNTFFVVSQDNKNIYVNNVLVDFGTLKNTIDSYFTAGFIKYYDLGSVLYIDFGTLGEHNGVFVDENGKVIKSLDQIFTGDDLDDTSVSKVDNDKIYLRKYNLTKQDGSEYCERLASKKLDDQLARIDLVSYLGNGEFKYEKGKESESFYDYESPESCTIKYLPSNIVSKFSGNYDVESSVGLVKNSYEYIFAIKDGKLLLLDYDAKIVKELSNNWVYGGPTLVKYENDYIIASVYDYGTNENKTLKYNVKTGEITN